MVDPHGDERADGGGVAGSGEQIEEALGVGPAADGDDQARVGGKVVVARGGDDVEEGVHERVLALARRGVHPLGRGKGGGNLSWVFY